MNKKLVFRMLGAVSSSLIIVSLFIPFISVSGYSQSLWQDYSKINAIYLPIMIIVFGVIGILCFSLNIKTELAYSTTGALLFYLITQTSSYINQGKFNTLTVGYYCLIIGTLLTGIMAFLSNLKTKQKVENITKPQENLGFTLNQIDALYNNQNENMFEQVPSLGIDPNMPEQVQPVSSAPVIPEPVQPVGLAPAMPESVQPVGPAPAMPEPVQPVGLAPAMPEPVQPVGLAPAMPESVQPVGLAPAMPESVQPVGLAPTLQSTNNVEEISNPVINEFTSSQNTVFPQPTQNVETVVEQPSNNLDIFN